MGNAQMTLSKCSKKSEDTKSMSEKSDSDYSETPIIKSKKRGKKRSRKALPFIESEESLEQKEDTAPPIIKINELECKTTDEPIEDVSSFLKDVDRTGRGPAMKYRVNKQEK